MFILTPQAVIVINTKIIFFVALFVIVFFGFSVYADDFEPKSYIFYLYFDKGKLVADRDFLTPYDVTTVEYQTTQGSFNGKIYSFRGETLGIFNFGLAQGRNEILAPYFFNAKQVVFYDVAGQELLIMSVAAHSFCNENGICDSDSGEDSDSCSSDCKLLPTHIISQTPPDNAGLSRGILFGIIGAIIAIVVWFIWLIIKKRKTAISELPSEDIPQPPVVPPSIQ